LVGSGQPEDLAVTGPNQPVPPEPAAVGEPLELRGRPLGSGAVVIEAHGILDLVHVGTLERAAAEQVAQGRTEILLDLSGVPLCDSVGLTALIRIHRLAAAHGGRLRLVAPRRQIRNLLELTNLTRLFDVYDSLADAQAAG
jgi:anti-anti-sigma factor